MAMNLKTVSHDTNAEVELGSPTLDSKWEVLGPFQVGTREASWGADPLEAAGGFASLSYDTDACFPSSLCPDGVAKWTLQDAKDVLLGPRTVESNVVLSFPNVDWETQRSYYGWAGLQYQGWARTQFGIAGFKPQTVTIYIDSIIEYRVDSHHVFGGDFYDYRRAPLVLQLRPGQHRLEVRFVRDIRAMGGTGSPTLPYKIKIEVGAQELLVQEDSILLPEYIQGYGPASKYGSVPVRNNSTTWVSVTSFNSIAEDVTIEKISREPTMVAPGQSVSIAFRFGLEKAEYTQLSFKIQYLAAGSEYSKEIVAHATIRTKSIEEAHKYTFLHPNSNVSYAIIKVPASSKMGAASIKQSAPVLINLHGAGLEADTEEVRHMLDDVHDLSAFTVYPTGGTSWSGDDWHTWGFADVNAAIAALPEWVKDTGWQGSIPNVRRLFCVGHSNGGQGTWFAITHQPDRFRGAAAVSGYASIQAYVPYTLWNVMDPDIWKTVQTSLGSFRHELLMDNITDIDPIVQQHGGSDDNVPTYHSRRLYQLLKAAGGSPQYTELPGQNHWFDGIMTTPALRSLYSKLSDDYDHGQPSTKFRTVYPQSGDMSSRRGISVDQLASPDLSGAIEVEADNATAMWTIKTFNIKRFHLDGTYFQGAFPQHLVVDGTALDASKSSEKQPCWYVKETEWRIESGSSWKTTKQRYGAQLGALDSFLRTRGPITVRYADCDLFDASLQIANNLYQYFSADCRLEIADENPKVRGNVVYVSREGKVQQTQPWHPIHIEQGAVGIRDSGGSQHIYHGEEGLGTIYLSPLPDESLQLNIWGFDNIGLAQACRLVPMLTGVGQPDFIVVSKQCAHKGAGGVYASGFLDWQWEASAASYFK